MEMQEPPIDFDEMMISLAEEAVRGLEELLNGLAEKREKEEQPLEQRQDAHMSEVAFTLGVIKGFEMFVREKYGAPSFPAGSTGRVLEHGGMEATLAALRDTQ